MKMFQINEESEYKPSPVKTTQHNHSNSAYNCTNINNNYLIQNKPKISKKNAKYIINEDENIVIDEEMTNSNHQLQLH